MFKLLKKWIKYEASFFFWSCAPVILIVIFGMVAVTYFSSFAIQSTGIFIIIIFFLMWFFPRKPR
jgi:hypothetical protein